jgi:hypothetical protein
MRQMLYVANSNKLLLLIAKVLLLIIPVLLVEAALFLVLPRNPTSYLHGFSLKDNLLRTTRSPRIILVGGSNLAFGIDSQALSREFGTHVVNTGLHADLGLGFILNAVEKDINTGDVVIISFEYYHYVAKTSRGDITLCELLFEEPRALRYLGGEHLPTIVEGLGRVCGQRLTWFVHGSPFKASPIYNAKAFNEYGDVISHLDKQPTEIPMSPMRYGPSVSSFVLKRLTQFIRHAEKMGAHVYIVPPSYRDREFAANAQSVESIYQMLKTRFPKQVLSKPQDFVFNGDDYFFDSQDHLNKRGRELRTAKLLETMRFVSLRDEWTLKTQTPQLQNGDSALGVSETLH